MEKYERLTDEQLISELRSGETGVMDFIMVKYKSMVRKKARLCIFWAERMKI